MDQKRLNPCRGRPFGLYNELEPEVKKEIPVICALAVGYPDPDFPANKLHLGRDPVAKHVVFLDA